MVERANKFECGLNRGTRLVIKRHDVLVCVSQADAMFISEGRETA